MTERRTEPDLICQQQESRTTYILQNLFQARVSKAGTALSQITEVM